LLSLLETQISIEAKFYMVADLECFCTSCLRYRQQDKAPNGALSIFRLVVLSLTMYAKRRVVVRCIVAMSHCLSVQFEGLANKSSDRATSRQRAARQRAVWRSSLEKGQQNDKCAVWRFVLLSLATRRKVSNDIGWVVAIDNTTCNLPNQATIVLFFKKKHFINLLTPQRDLCDVL
jgi:hypothetical protein